MVWVGPHSSCTLRGEGDALRENLWLLTPRRGGGHSSSKHPDLLCPPHSWSRQRPWMHSERRSVLYHDPSTRVGCTASDDQCRITTLVHAREKGARRRNSPWAAPLPVSRVAPSCPASSIVSPRSGPGSRPLLPQLLPAHLGHSPPFRARPGGRRPAWSVGLVAGALP